MPLSKKQKRFITTNYKNFSLKQLAAKTGAVSGEIKGYVDTLNYEISPLKKRIFTIVLLLVPVLFFIVLEGGLRIFHYGEDTSLFKSAAGEYSQYNYINRWVGGRYFNQSAGVPDPPNDIFLKHKPENPDWKERDVVIHLGYTLNFKI